MIHSPNQCDLHIIRQPTMLNFHESSKRLWFTFIGKITQGAGNCSEDAFKKIWTGA